MIRLRICEHDIEQYVRYIYYGFNNNYIEMGKWWVNRVNTTDSNLEKYGKLESLVFCISHNASTLFRNLQNRSSVYRRAWHSPKT